MNKGIVISKTFQPKCKFMPYLIRYKLCIYILYNKSDLLRLYTIIYVSKFFPLKTDSSFPFSTRCQNGFQLSEQCRLPTSGTTCDNDKAALFYGKADIL